MTWLVELRNALHNVLGPSNQMHRQLIKAEFEPRRFSVEVSRVILFPPHSGVAAKLDRSIRIGLAGESTLFPCPSVPILTLPCFEQFGGVTQECSRFASNRRSRVSQRRTLHTHALSLCQALWTLLTQKIFHWSNHSVKQVVSILSFTCPVLVHAMTHYAYLCSWTGIAPRLSAPERRTLVSLSAACCED